VLVLNAIQALDPSSVWISRLEQVVAQFHTLVDLLHRRVIEGEQIPSAKKLL